VKLDILMRFRGTFACERRLVWRASACSCSADQPTTSLYPKVLDNLVPTLVDTRYEEARRNAPSR